MNRKAIFTLVLWLICLVCTIVELCTGAGPELLVLDCLGLASPLIVYLTSRRK